MVPKLDPAKTLLFLRSETLVMERERPQQAFSVIRSPAPGDLAAITAAVDGRRSLDEICSVLDSYETESVVKVIESLTGLVFQRSEPPPAPAAPRITIVGRGSLAIRLARACGATRLLWVGDDAPADADLAIEPVARAALARRLRDEPQIVAAHDGGSLADAIEINRIALATGTTCVHVLAEADTLVVGPCTVPFKTACLECSQINRYFENYRADDASHALHGLSLATLAPPHDAFVAEAAATVVRELTGLASGSPYPMLFGSQLRMSLADGIRPVELVPTTNCESCRGCNAEELDHDVRTERIPALAPLDTARPLVTDTSGGVRSIDLEEAQRRVAAAAARLGAELHVRGYSERLRARYPELLDLPFVAMDARLTYSPDAPFVIARPPEPCFGKGAIVPQALCSGMFEFVERTLQMYRGGVRIVRAPYAAVRDHAIDMMHFTHGVLDIPDRGPRVDFDPAHEIDWCWARCLATERPILIPAYALFPGIFNTRERDPLFTFRGAHVEMPRCGSSGLAAGATREDAVLQGLYELVEHDTRLIQCRTGVPAPAIDPATIDEPSTRKLLDVIAASGFDVVLRYLSRDIRIPVVEAYLTSQRDLTFFRVPGWGAHHDPAIAIRRALTEAVQCIGAVESVASQTFRYGMYSITNSFHENQYCVDRTDGTIAFGDLPRPAGRWTTIGDYLRAAVSDVLAAVPGSDLCFFDYPSHGLEGVHVTRVFATGLVRTLHQTAIVQDRLRDAYRAAGRGDRRLELAELFLGDLKI